MRVGSEPLLGNRGLMKQGLTCQTDHLDFILGVRGRVSRDSGRYARCLTLGPLNLHFTPPAAAAAHLSQV